MKSVYVKYFLITGDLFYNYIVFYMNQRDDAYTTIDVTI